MPNVSISSIHLRSPSYRHLTAVGAHIFNSSLPFPCRGLITPYRHKPHLTRVLANFDRPQPDPCGVLFLVSSEMSGVAPVALSLGVQGEVMPEIRRNRGHASPKPRSGRLR